MKNVLITGAGRGIGLGLTEQFLSHGFRVAGTYRHEGSAEKLFKLAQDSDAVIPIKADVGDAKSFGPLKDLLHKLKTIDVLINNAGVIGNRGRSLFELDLEKLDDVFTVNTWGPLRMCQLVMPVMPSGSTVAHVSSLMGSITDNQAGGYYDYRMSKTALNMFNACLAKEFPQHKCIVLHPGWVQTEMGGAGATTPVTESVKGLYNVITTAQLSGKFFDFKGKELPW